MKEKTVRARKEHFCSCCCEPIRVGEPYWMIKHKFPKFDIDIRAYDHQIGIEYEMYRIHMMHREDIVYHCEDEGYEEYYRDGPY